MKSPRIFEKDGMKRVVVIVGLVFCTLPFLLLLSYLLLDLTGNTWKSASNKWSQAMSEGDGQAAIFWAKRGYAIAKRQRSDGLLHHFERYIALAYELDGQFDEALLWMTRHSNHTAFFYSAEGNFYRGRLLFKQDKREEAFKAYCRGATMWSEHFAQDLAYKGYLVNTGGWYTRNNALQKLRFLVTMAAEVSSAELRLTAFWDYEDFLFFMEEKYEKHACSEEYAEAMKLFRAVVSEFDEKYSMQPRRTIADLRETLRQEQVQKQENVH